MIGVKTTAMILPGNVGGLITVNSDSVTEII